MKGLNVNDLLLIAGAAGIAYAIYASNKMDKLCKKIDKSVDDISSNMEVDISDALIDAAVEKAVEREVYQAVKKATGKAVKDIESDISKDVKAAVKEHYANLKDDVAKEMHKQVGEIDIREIREDVVEKAKKQLAEKFDDNLDGLLDKFNGELDNVSKIYRSIARNMTADSDKGIALRIG